MSSKAICVHCDAMDSGIKRPYPVEQLTVNCSDWVGLLRQNSVAFKIMVEKSDNICYPIAKKSEGGQRMGKNRKNKKISQLSNVNRQQPAAPERTSAAVADKKDKHEAHQKIDEKGTYFVWGLLAAILTWLLGCIFYDIVEKIASLIIIIVGAIGLISGLFTIFGVKIDIASESQKNRFLALSIGVIAGAAVCFYVCDSLAYRLRLVPMVFLSNAPETAETTDVGTGTESSEVPSKDPVNDAVESEGLSVQESVMPEATENSSLETGSAGSETDSEPNTPITVTVNPESNNLMSFDVINDFYKMIDASNEGCSLSPTAENKEYVESVLTDKIKSYLNTNSLPDGKGINQNRDFTSETEGANRIQHDIKDNGQSLDKQRNLIAHREKAYAVYPAHSLDNLLSDNYFELARLYKVEGKWEDAYQCYMKSIRHEIQYIKSCTEANDHFYVRLYNIAVRCHGIGDTDGLNTETKQQAYYLAVCLFEAASKNEFSYKFQNHQAKCYYYAGMTNHKLLRLHPNEYNSEMQLYFSDAYMFYEKSLRYSGDKKYKYTYLAQLCEWALAYIDRQEAAEGMKTREEYEQLWVQYRDLGW